MARVRIGGPDASWMPCAVESLREMVPDLPFVLVERVMPPRDADALLEDLRAEATTWGQDEWWIAGEARKAPRLTAVYEMRVEDDGEGHVGVGPRLRPVEDQHVLEPHDLRHGRRDLGGSGPSPERFGRSVFPECARSKHGQE